MATFVYSLNIMGHSNKKVLSFGLQFAKFLTSFGKFQIGQGKVLWWACSNDDKER